MTWRIAVRRHRPTSRYALRGGAAFAALVTALGLAATTPADAATSYRLKVSATADRATPHVLANSKLKGYVYVFVDPATRVKSVAFYVDDPKRLRKASRVDSTQPYDLRGGSAAKAAAWNTAGLKDGKHTVTAVVTTTTGHKSVVTSSFTASNPTPRPLATAAKAGNGRVTLTWASGGARTGGFQIYRSTSIKVPLKKPINAKPLAKTVSHYTDRTVKNGRTYYYVIRAISPSHAAASGLRVSARPLLPPKLPTAVTAVSGDGRITVSWASGGGTVQGWRVLRGSSSTVTPLYLTLPATAHSFVDTPLANGTTYYYRIQVYADAFHATSAAVNGTPIPAPNTVTAVPDDKKVTINWGLGTGGAAITGFKVYVGTTPSVSTTGTPAASTTHSEIRTLPVTQDGSGNPLVNGTTYYFRVVSVSANGKAPAAAIVGVPVPTITLTATPSSGLVQLSWNTTGSETTSYNVYRGNGTTVPPTGPTDVPLATITDGTTGYPDSSVAQNTTYTYVVVAVADAWTSKSAPKQARTPSIGYGPTASGWGGSLSPTNIDWPAGPVKSALGSSLTDFRYVFNRIGTTNVDKSDTLHVKPWSGVTLRNGGSSPVTISSITSTGPFSVSFVKQGPGTGNYLDNPDANPDVSFPYALAPGASIHVKMQFDYCRTGCSPLPIKGVQYGQLTINSNDAGHTVSTLPLAGAWQATAGGSDELPLTTFINQVLGIQTRLTGGNDAHGVYKGINYGNGLVAAVGEEVLSPYWRATGSSISVRQIVATHSAGGSEPLQWFAQGNPGTTASFMRQAGTDYQTLLPGGSNGPRSEGTVSPTSPVFGFRVNSGTTADWSDDTMNQGPTLANDIRHGCTGPCGHHVRFFPLRTASGVVANTYLMCVDSQGVNLDFNDVDYIITGITPA